jgi:hypothetical protein
MEKAPGKPKGSTKVIAYRIIAIVLLVLQLLAYAGKATADKSAGLRAENIGYWFGYNFALWLSILFFYLSFKASRKIKQNANIEMLDSIGKNE